MNFSSVPLIPRWNTNVDASKQTDGNSLIHTNKTLGGLCNFVKSQAAVKEH